MFKWILRRFKKTLKNVLHLQANYRDGVITIEVYFDDDLILREQIKIGI